MDVDHARETLLGAWRLVSYEDRNSADDPWFLPFGDEPRGVIVYHPSGMLSVQIAAAPRVDGDAWSTIAYLGSFEVHRVHRDGARFIGVVLHHMEVAHPRELLDDEPERDFQVDGDVLTLGDGLTWRRVLHRIDEPPVA